MRSQPYEAYGKQIYKGGQHYMSCHNESSATTQCKNLNEIAGYGRCS